MAVRKLKVFQAQFGFYDTVVAAASQAAALRAWGTRQNLFASGDAKVMTDEAAVAAALEHPEIPLRRAVGSTDAFQLEPKSLPKAPNRPKRATKSAANAAKFDPRPAPLADRTPLDDAERALRALDKARSHEEADLRVQQEKLDAKKAAAQSAYVDHRKRATAAIIKARQAYRKAGGQD